MAVRLHALIAVGITAALASGCSLYGRGKSSSPPPPAPLAAAPTGTVTGEVLPPPGSVAATQPQPSGLAALNPSLQASAGQPVGAQPAGAQPAGAQVAAAQPPPAAGGGQIGRTDLLGGWTINSAGETCQLFMTLTTWAGGYRASTRGCTAPALQTISSWNMDGSQVQLLNDSGTTIARLLPTNKSQFSGQTEGGGPITVTR